MCVYLHACQSVHIGIQRTAWVDHFSLSPLSALGLGFRSFVWMAVNIAHWVLLPLVWQSPCFSAHPSHFQSLSLAPSSSQLRFHDTRYLKAESQIATFLILLAHRQVTPFWAEYFTRFCPAVGREMLGWVHAEIQSHRSANSVLKGKL